MELLVTGATNKQISERLVVTEATTKSHVAHILRKLRAGNRAEAVHRYMRLLASTTASRPAPLRLAARVYGRKRPGLRATRPWEVAPCGCR